ncbi:ParA family protein [Bradyrhizobium sp. HKCCYLS2058]|uniref:ParA family protein n=1 Tax=unclassified Bradyrhizobium TaxID=2631580 RepID=UPI003EBD0095
MAKRIALFNHKGGVSKTTTSFNLGWMLAKKGKRVLLVDCDPQCNLTGMFLGFEGIDDLEEIYNKGGVRNLRDGLAPAFESKPTPLSAVTCEVMKQQKNLLLLPGHIGIAEYETTLGIAQELSGSLVTLQNLPGAIPHLLDLTAKEYEIDIVLIDMSPSLGPINQNLVATSDFFLVPMAPDYFSMMAVESLASVLPKWKAWADKASSIKILQEATYPLPPCHPKFMGTIIQKYRLRHGNTPSTAFQKWINEIQKKVDERLLPALSSCDMLLPDATYKAAGFKAGQPVLQMSDFNGLIAQSQKHSAPVFALTDTQLEQTGIVLERTKKSMKQFAKLFSAAADRVIKLIDNA